MTTPTANAVPSAAPQDLLYNAEMLDQAMNSSLPAVYDRKGIARLTLAGAMSIISVLNPRGAWATATAYQPRDLVLYSSNWYLCLDAHTSGATFAGDHASHWRLHQDSDASSLETQFGADPTGATDSTAAFAAALAASAGDVHCTPGAIYLLKDLVVDSRRLHCNGAIFRWASGARWGIKLKGYAPRLYDPYIQDSSAYVRETTVSTGALISATALVVSSATGIEVGQVAMIEVDAAGSWVVSEVSSVVGTTVNIRDALPSAVSSGKRVAFLFGGLWVENAQWWEITGGLTVNAVGALLIKPTAGGISNKGWLPNFSTDGSKYFGVCKQGDAAGVKAVDAKLWGGFVETYNRTGDGTAGPFALGLDGVYLKRDVSVTVNGVAKTTPTHWTYASGTTIQFTAGNEPANGAAIVITHFRCGIRGLVLDARASTIINGGNNFAACEALGSFIGLDANSQDLTDFSDMILDSCQYVGLQAQACPAGFNFKSGFIGFNGANIKAFNGSSISFGRIYTQRVPSGYARSAVVDHNIQIDSTSTVDLDVGQWTGGDYQASVAGKINWRNGRHVNLYSTPGSAVAAASTVYLNINGHSGPGLPTQAQVLAADTTALEIIAQVGAAPGGVQTFTYQLNVNGIDVGSTFTISGAATAASLVLAENINKGDRLLLKLITSATAVATEHRAVVVLR